MTISGELHVVADDPDDDKIVECAVVAQASFIVSRNRHLLDLKEYEGIQIVTADFFLTQLESSA